MNRESQPAMCGKRSCALGYPEKGEFASRFSPVVPLQTELFVSSRSIRINRAFGRTTIRGYFLWCLLRAKRPVAYLGDLKLRLRDVTILAAPFVLEGEGLASVQPA
jgi:hypothetical protein